MSASRDTVALFAQQGLEHTPIPNDTLSGKAVKFNGSIIEWKGKRLLAYRRYDLGHGRMNLAFSTLGEDWLPDGKHFVPAMPCRQGDEKHEDVRLFIHKERLWMSCSEIYKADRGWGCAQRVFRLDDKLQIDRTLDIRIGRNFKGTEKNWAFFSRKDKLYFYYDFSSQNVFEVDDETGAVKQAWDAKRFHWPYGHMRGGTAPQWVEGKGFLTFLHSATTHEWRLRRYSMSACIFSDEPPFNVLSLSEKPIAYGTRNEDFCNSGNGQCIFPCGQILDKDAWHVSCGVNDTFNTIFHLNPKKVMQGMVPAEQFLVDRKEYWISSKPALVPFIAQPEYLWEPVWSGQHRKTIGLLCTDDPFALAYLAKDENCARVPKEEWTALRPKNILGSCAVTAQEAERERKVGMATMPIPTGIQMQRGAQRNQPPPKKPDGRILYK